MRLTKGKGGSERSSLSGRAEIEERDIIGPARPALRQLKEQLVDGDTLAIHMDDGTKLLIRLVGVSNGRR